MSSSPPQSGDADRLTVTQRFGPLACALLLILMTSACVPDQPIAGGSEVPAIQLSKDGSPITPLCVEGCLDPDPDPDAVGYFLPGLENQFEHCADGDVDWDQDGLDDGCELALALAFAPQMSFAVGDEVRREPRWAAQWLNGDPATHTVRIAYLHSYWMDMGDGGTSEGLCEVGGVIPILNLVISLEDCGGHAGDSEWIRLDVKYNFQSQHWYLADAAYSAHEWHVDFQAAADTVLWTVPEATPSYSTRLEYGDKRGGYPVSYVADRKHANYPTRRFCNDHGGVIDGLNSMSDSCSLPRYVERLEVGTTKNIGSRAHQFINCVGTQRPDHPNYGSALQECYWSSWSVFTGWFNVGSGASAYGILLYDHFAF